MNKFKICWLGLVAVGALALAGCGGSTEDESVFTPPAVDVNGEWNTFEDGSYLGIMKLIVSSTTGDLDGELVTKDGAQARLYGTMAGYAATFSMIFPAEDYQVKVVFAQTGDTAVGTAADADPSGLSRSMTLTRRTPP